jgi:hypothetical protein
VTVVVKVWLVEVPPIVAVITEPAAVVRVKGVPDSVAIPVVEFVVLLLAGRVPEPELTAHVTT